MPDKRQSPENSGLLWIVVGDIHDETGNFAKIPELVKAAGIIVTGDLTQFGGAKEAKKVLEAIGESGLPVLAQIGNMDKPEIDEWLTAPASISHTVVRELCPRALPFSALEPRLLRHLTRQANFPEKTYSHWLKQEWDRAGEISLYRACFPQSAKGHGLRLYSGSRHSCPGPSRCANSWNRTSRISAFAATFTKAADLTTLAAPLLSIRGTLTLRRLCRYDLRRRQAFGRPGAGVAMQKPLDWSKTLCCAGYGRHCLFGPYPD